MLRSSGWIWSGCIPARSSVCGFPDTAWISTVSPDFTVSTGFAPAQ